MRPIEHGLFYFPLDCGFFQNKKIKMLRRTFGPVGVLTYINLLCRIYQRGYYITFDDIESLSIDIAEDIAYTQAKRTAAQVTEIIAYLIDQGILDKCLFEQNVISGKAIQMQYAECVKTLKRKAQIDIYSLLEKKEEGQGVGGSTPKIRINSEETAINSEETRINPEKTRQRERENKKENNIHTTRAYGVCNNVMLTEAEYAALCREIPNADAYIGRFSAKMAERGYTYPNHYDAILAWWGEDKGKVKKATEKAAEKTSSIDATYDVNAFFAAALERGIKHGQK